MKVRAVTGFFFVILMLASVLLGAKVFAVFFTVLSLFTLSEFYTMVRSESIKPQRLTGIFLAATLIIPVALSLVFNQYLIYALLAIPAALLIGTVELYRKKKNPILNISITYFGVIYVIAPFCFFAALAFVDTVFNFHFPLAFLLMLWASDTGAYLFGVKFGKHKLFERHSPKKSWEGLFGGLITSLLVAFIISTQYHELSVEQWLFMSFIIVISGSIGDLFESMLKRSLSVKDSGSILPGHGGLLDRFDGLLFAAPLVYIYLYWLFMFR